MTDFVTKDLIIKTARYPNTNRASSTGHSAHHKQKLLSVNDAQWPWSDWLMTQARTCLDKRMLAEWICCNLSLALFHLEPEGGRFSRAQKHKAHLMGVDEPLGGVLAGFSECEDLGVGSQCPELQPGLGDNNEGGHCGCGGGCCWWGHPEEAQNAAAPLLASLQHYEIQSFYHSTSKVQCHSSSGFP